MATLNGPTQANGQIRWWYQVGGVTQGSASVAVKVDAYYFQVAPYYQTFNGTKSWSGSWGSGSAAQAFNLGAGAQVKIVTWSSQFTLTDSAQKRSFTATARHWFGTTSHTLTITIPARYARTPTGLTITRVSDTSHRLNWSRTSTYTSVVVQRRVNGGSWTQVGRPGGNAYTWTDTSTRAGNKYEYRVAGVGGSGQSGWSNTATVYTSPNAPTGVTAERVGSGIVVNASGKPPYASSYNVRDGSATVATNVQLPWTHVNPDAAQVHQYTVQGVVSGLAGAWSAASNAVQLISPPLAPSGLSPNGAVSVSDASTLLKWKHNPIDSSAQSAGEVRYRARGASAWTTRTVTTPQQYTVSFAAGEHEWQVRTKGSHPDWSPWSAIATVTVIDRPGVAITSPDGLWTRRTVTAEWTWEQGQGRPQSSWEAVLTGPDGEIERRAGTGSARKVEFSAKVLDNVSYGVTVRAATGDIWSEPAEQWFLVQVPPAAPADVSAEWGEDDGAVTVEVYDGRGDVLDPVTNHFPYPRFAGDGTWAELRRNLAVDPVFTSLRKKLGSATNNMSAGGGAALSIEEGWSVAGGSSLKIGVGNNSGAAYLNWAGASEGMSLDVWGGKRYTVAATVFRDEVAGDLGNGANTPPRAIAVGLDIGGVRTWVHARSELAPDSIGEDRLVVSFDLPAGSSSDFWFIRLFNGSATQPVWWDALTVEEGNTDGSFFGWDHVPHDGMRVRALGTAPFAQSALEGERVRGITVLNGHGVVASVDGVPAMRLVANHDVNDVYARWDMPSSAPIAGGVAMSTLHLEAPLTGELAGRSRQFYVGTPNQNFEPVPPNVAGIYPQRINYTELSGITRLYWVGGNRRGHGDTVWTDPGLFVPDYRGPAFSGSSGLVKVGESWMAATWDGEVDKSTSTLRMAPAAVRADVERSVDDGLTWVPFIEGASLPVLQTDPEAKSNGVTLYRVTTYSADDATSVVVHEAEADSPAVWLSGGEGFTRAARLPYDPQVSIVRGRERVVRRYAGRTKPVVHAGEGTTRTVDYGGTLILDEQSEVELEDIVADEAPIHLLRFPDGRHMYGAIGDVQLTREPHGDWTFGFQLTETEQ